MKKIFIIFALIIAVLFSNYANAWFTISPLKYEFEAKPWTSKKEKIRITNDDDKPITLYSSMETFMAWDVSWNPKFVKIEDQTDSQFSLSNWINVEDKNITLAPKETREVYFDLNIPKNAEPGWHYAAIFFYPWTPSWAQVAMVNRLWILILVNVEWNVKVEWKLDSFKIGNNNDNKDFIENTTFKDFPIIFETIFENLWNVHLKPNWKVTLIDQDWKTLENIWKERLLSTAWAYLWEKMVDYIPINDSFWNVLPKSKRKFDWVWEGFWYTILNDDGTKSVKFKNLTEYYADKASEKAQFLMPWQSINTRTVEKKITAKFELSYEWKDKIKKDFLDSKDFYITYEEKYVWINYIISWIVIIIIIWILYYFILVAPKNKSKKEEELRKKIIEEMNKNKTMN